ncbi:MAG: helix-turn-helix domain-containing protein [Nitrospinae bacterium]|nr:helix-turn-helix domain-containing protein [Nitrospinota bacterium]
MTLEEVAQYLHLSKDSVYRMAQRGAMPASKVARQWRFDKQELDTWMRSDRRRPSGSSGNTGDAEADSSGSHEAGSFHDTPS